MNGDLLMDGAVKLIYSMDIVEKWSWLQILAIIIGTSLSFTMIVVFATIIYIKSNISQLLTLNSLIRYGQSLFSSTTENEQVEVPVNIGVPYTKDGVQNIQDRSTRAMVRYETGIKTEDDGFHRDEDIETSKHDTSRHVSREHTPLTYLASVQVRHSPPRIPQITKNTLNQENDDLADLEEEKQKPEDQQSWFQTSPRKSREQKEKDFNVSYTNATNKLRLLRERSPFRARSPFQNMKK